MEAALSDELVGSPKNRFANNMRRHTGIDLSSVKAKLESIAENLQALSEIELQAANRMWLVVMRRLVSSFFAIVPLKAQ